MHFNMQNPEYGVVGRKYVSSVIGNANTSFASTSGTSRCKEPHYLFDHREGVVQAVYNAGLLSEVIGRGCWIRT
jgi:hypothetical protein